MNNLFFIICLYFGLSNSTTKIAKQCNGKEIVSPILTFFTLSVDPIIPSVQFSHHSTYETIRHDIYIDLHEYNNWYILKTDLDFMIVGLYKDGIRIYIDSQQKIFISSAFQNIEMLIVDGSFVYANGEIEKNGIRIIVAEI